MRKLICKLLGHNWKRCTINMYAPYRRISLFQYCLRCHKREEYQFSLIPKIHRWTPAMYTKPLTKPKE